MIGVSFTLAAIFIVSALHQDVAASKPKITPGGEKIIQEGEELRIECRGQGRLQFSRQEITESEIDPADFRVFSDKATGTYVFVRLHATRKDTGWYACAEEGIPIRNDEQTLDHPSENISWIYVYVNSSMPFAVMDAFFTPVTTVADGTVVIPCRPTSPKLPVELLDYIDDVVPVAGNISYDPKIGFIMAYVDGSRNGAVYRCNIQGGDLTSYQLWYTLEVKAPDVVPPGAIKTEESISAFLKQNLTLHCNIIRYEGSNVRLSWKAPNSVPEERLLRTSSQTKWFHDDIISTNLTIINVEEGDGGEYFCEANGTSNLAHTSTIVRVIGISASKPEMTPAAEEIIIQEGEDLRLECRGEGRLQFSTQKITEASIELSDYTVSFDEASGAYTFLRPRTTRRDTGWYACANEGILITNDEQTIDHPSENISWIYVYVNSSEPFAIMESLYDTIEMVAGSVGVLPCRPTLPDLPVIFDMPHSDVPAHLLEHSKYDPKIGFIFEDVSKEKFEESYECRLDGTYEIEDTSWPLYVVHVADEQKLPQPTIIQDKLHHVVWGKDMTLECRITVQAEKFSLHWKVPSSVPEERCHYSDTSLVDRSGRKTTWRKELTVKDVQESDGGEYICYAKGVKGEISQSSKTIKIWDPSHTYINVSLDLPDHVLWEKDTAKWKFRIDAYPERYTLEWYKDNQTLIKTNETDERSRYSHYQIGLDHYFGISSLNVKDNGRYTIRVSTSHNSKDIFLSLTVLGKPIVHMCRTLPYYEPGETTILSSQILGLPLPNVTWSYLEYPDFPSKENSRLISLLNIRTERVGKTQFHLVSNVNVTINMTGDVICRSCNDIKCTESTQLILVSEVARDFGIKDPGIVTEGDDIEVLCAASVYKFADDIFWEPFKVGTLDPISERIQITKQKTRFTSQSILHIRDVKKSDSGKYFICVAFDKVGHHLGLLYKLQVEDARLPVITYTNMNDSEIWMNLEGNENEALTLECRAEGRPIPEITWYKNDKLLKESKQFRFSADKTRLQIKYFVDAETDNGRYSCNVRNSIGRTERYMDIRIRSDSPSTAVLLCWQFVHVIDGVRSVGSKSNCFDLSSAQRNNLSPREKDFPHSGLSHNMRNSKLMNPSQFTGIGI